MKGWEGEGEEGGVLSITASPHPIGLLNVCMRANTWYTYCLFLSLYTGLMIKTGTERNLNKGHGGRGAGGGKGRYLSAVV